MQTNDKLSVTVVRLLNNGNPTPSPSPSTPVPSWTPTAPDHGVYWAGVVYQQVTGPDIAGNVTVSFEVPLPPGYNGLQVIASLSGAQVCPQQAPQPTQSTTPQATHSTTPEATQSTATATEQPDYACLTLDAPSSASATSTPTTSSTSHTANPKH
jgi:hypothetical protein